MLNNFIYAQTKELFLEALNARNILDEAIVFIEDTKEIWNRGHYFGGSNGSEINPEIISELQTAIAALQSNKTDKSELADYAKKSELPSLDGYLTKTAAKGLYATIAQYNTLNQTVGNIQTELSNKLTSSDLADYAKTADVPTKISDLTDDSDFITNTEATAAYAPKSLVTTVSNQATTISTLATKDELSTGLAGKLDNSAASGFVPTTRKVNGKALDTDITITATDPNAATKDSLNNVNTDLQNFKNSVALTYATDKDVADAIANLVDSSPETLNTLDELAAALGDDPNFATTVATNIGKKADQTALDDTNTNLSNLTAKVNGNSVTKSGETLTVTINGTSQSLTNTNTWRSISDTVNSTSSDVSASSKAVKTAYDLANTANTAAVNAQNTANSKWTYNEATIKAVKVSNAGYADSAGSAGSVAWTNVSGRPSSLPASDVYAWAKASSKPSYSASEVGALPTSGGIITGGTITIGSAGLPLLGGAQIPTNQMAIGRNGIAISCTDTRNDAAAIFVENISSESNRLVIAMGDDATSAQDYIVFRQYTTSGTVGHEVTVPRTSGTLALTSQIPTNTNQLTNGAGYITGITKAMVTTALGYIPPTTNTTYSAATTSADGLMSKSDKSKLDGIASGATAVSSSTVSGWGFTKNTGTVTSVAMTVPTGLSVSGTPITTSGTLALSFASGYSIPTTAKQGNWDTAYGWGNHASAGYVKSSGVTSVATGTGLTGGTITSTGTISINTTYQGYITNGNKAWASHTKLAANKINAIPVTHKVVTCPISAAGSFAISGTMTAGQVIHVIVQNTTTSAIAVTIPNSGSYHSFSGSSLSVPASGYAEINVVYNGEKMFIRTAY